ncbi:MAG: ribonuclease HII [Selenomonadaceae bacterium]|nr:ribonuclease HII [Selenomonadaceae bacterium]
MKRFSIEADEARVKKLYKYEDKKRAEGFKLIAGVDEAGRGSLVGALVVAAVILPDGLYLERLDDSKKLSAKVREQLYDEITDKAISWNAVRVEVEEIDRRNIYQATLQGMKRAIEGLDVQPDFV